MISKKDTSIIIAKTIREIVKEYKTLSRQLKNIEFAQVNNNQLIKHFCAKNNVDEKTVRTIAGWNKGAKILKRNEDTE